MPFVDRTDPMSVRGGYIMQRANERKRARNGDPTHVRSEDPKRSRLPQQVKDKMVEYFKSGKYGISEIALACGVCYRTARNFVDKDPELKELWETAMQARLDMVVDSMVERAIDGRNEIAAQQAGEFLLRHHRRDQYSDKASVSDMAKQLPKVVVPVVVNRGPAQSIPAEHRDASVTIDV